MSMLKKILFAMVLFFTTSLALYSQGTLTGRIIDEDTKEPIISANVIVLQNGEQIGKGAAANIDGEFRISPLEGGKYDIQVSYSGYQTKIQSDVVVRATGYTRVGDISIKSGIDLGTVKVEAKKNIVEATNSSSGKTISTDEIEKMPANSITEIVASTAGVNETSSGESGNMRGEKSVTYVGGVQKSTGVNVPKEAIGEIKVILGGVPASIGEAMGGVQQITLRPPSNKFIGLVAYTTSEPLDTRGMHRGDFYLTGPIWKKKLESGAERTIIGFRFSGYNTYTADRYRRTGDNYYWMAKEDVVERISKNPLVYNSTTGSVDYAASYLTKDDFEQVGRKSNVWMNDLNLDGELSFQLSTNSVLKISGAYSNTMGRTASVANMFLNNTNNSMSSSNSLSLMVDYSQKFLSDNNNKSSLVRDIIFNVVGLYERAYSETYNVDLGDNFFRYGYAGKFITHRKRSYVLDRMEINGVEQWVYRQQAGLLDYQVDFIPSDYNAGMAAYTSQLYYGADFASLRELYEGTELAYNRNYTMIRTYGGFINGDDMNPSSSPSIYGIANNIGSPYTSYSKGEDQYFKATAKVTANIGDEIYPHSLELGFQYEQAIHRGYGLDAGSLWTIMKQNVNKHFIDALDMSNPIIDESGTYPVISYNFLYNADQQTFFDRSIRQALGLAVDGTDIIDIDSYDPDMFSMDMFEPDELFNSGNSIISYYGYDHTGAKITGKKSLQDFFSNKSRTLGAWQPIYMAGYIQDQFQIRNLIFNVGVRVTRFDANQQVLKDPYLLWNAYTVGDFRSAGYSDRVNSKMGDDYVVYVDKLNDDPTMASVEIKGYRNGNTWYDANGTEVSDPYTSIAGSEAKPVPYRKGDLGAAGYPVDTKGNLIAFADAFKDYEPEWVVEPRIAFSFPATDNSIFKASYEVIATRPSDGNWRANYMNYLPDFFNKIGANQTTITNPALKSEKITNYELGFEQALTKNSKVGITAFYKQTRDLVNLIQYVGADPAGTYYTLGNQDFRTIKGASFEYVLRYSKNFNFDINYTLQYAEGTVGLPASTARGLIRAGYPNIKLMFPTSDDNRHQIKFTATYSFGDGKDYNGPTTTRKVVKDGEDMVKNIRWFQNAGISLHGVLTSGAPYTRRYSQTQTTIVGSFQGSRLPWWYRLDLYVYKGFNIQVGKKSTELEVFCRVRNLLNTKSIISVFSVTGDAADDGYLTDPETQNTINSQVSVEAYRAYYSMMLNNAYYNYITPTTIDLGIKYSF